MQEASSTTSSPATRQFLRFAGPCFALHVIRYNSKSFAGRFCRNVVREVLTICDCASLLLPILITRSGLRGSNCSLPVLELVPGYFRRSSRRCFGDLLGVCAANRRTRVAGSISPIRTGPDRVGLSDGLFGGSFSSCNQQYGFPRTDEPRTGKQSACEPAIPTEQRCESINRTRDGEKMHLTMESCLCTPHR